MLKHSTTVGGGFQGWKMATGSLDFCPQLEQRPAKKVPNLAILVRRPHPGLKNIAGNVWCTWALECATEDRTAHTNGSQSGFILLERSPPHLRDRGGQALFTNSEPEPTYLVLWIACVCPPVSAISPEPVCFGAHPADPAVLSRLWRRGCVLALPIPKPDSPMGVENASHLR